MSTTLPTPSMESSETSGRVHACTKCPKKYWRRDYLERHALNHDRPTSVCELCGKGFARPDVLRRHQAKACTFGAEGSRADPQSSERRQSRSSASPAEDRPLNITPAGSSLKRKRHLSCEPSTAQPSSAPLRQRDTSMSSSGQVIVPDSQMPFASSVSRSPSKTSTKSTSWPLHPDPSELPRMPIDPFDGPNGDQPPIIPVEDHVSSLDPTTTTAGEELEWSLPIQTGDNMDDLLSWLFNASPNSNLFSTGDLSKRPPLVDDGGDAGLVQDEPPPVLQNPVRRESLTANLSLRRPPSAASSRQPQPYHTYAVPNVSQSHAYPSFSDDWISRSAWTMLPRHDILDENVRASMMELLDADTKSEPSSSTFRLQQMRLYLELYFMHFAPLYPIIHRQSLCFRRLPPDLLLTMICIGSAFAEDKEGLQVATRIHKRIRNRIFEVVEDEPVAPVSSLQTLLLINYFARSFCSLKQHDVGQIFHSPSIMLARLSGVFLPHYERTQISPSDNPLTCWLSWVEEEERKRVGWFAFMVDTENAALYRHYLLTHCFSIQIDFPVDEAVWDAVDPFVWSTALRQSLPQPSFRNALRELAGRGSIPPNVTQLSVWILLYGLLSISWTLLWRDLGDLSMIHDSKITGWKDSLRQAFGVWRNHVGQEALHRKPPTAPLIESCIHSAGIPFAYLGCVLLLSDTEQIRIFAGTNKIAGRPVSPGEWAAANAYVNTWARSQDGAYSCYAAAELLSHVFQWSSESRFQTAPSIVPWCLYIATLVIWTYASVLDGHDRLQESYIIVTPSLSSDASPSASIEPSLARADALAYLEKLLQCGHPFALPGLQGKNRCAGIVAYTAYLAGRLKRGITEESKAVLMGLLTEHVG